MFSNACTALLKNSKFLPNKGKLMLNFAILFSFTQIVVSAAWIMVALTLTFTVFTGIVYQFRFHNSTEVYNAFEYLDLNSSLRSHYPWLRNDAKPERKSVPNVSIDHSWDSSYHNCSLPFASDVNIIRIRNVRSGRNWSRHVVAQYGGKKISTFFPKSLKNEYEIRHWIVNKYS